MFADWNGVTTMVYDAVNQLTGKTDPGAYVQAYTYNAAQERTEVIDPQDGVHTTYYDLDGRTERMRDPDGIVTTFQYDSRGFKTTTVFDYGRKQKNTYDADGRNTVIHDEIDKDNQYQTFTYTFDGNNNRVGILDSNGSQTTYTYDAKDRISTAQTSGTINHTYTYTFDSRDNILSNTENTSPVTMTYDAASRLVTSVQGTATTTYTFDVNGNMTNVEVGTNPMVEFAYDNENRLIDVGSETMSYYSNGLLRIKKKVFDEAILLWDGQDLLLAQDASSPSDFWHFGVVDGLVIYEQYSSTRSDLLVDYLGSLTGVTESDGSGSSYTRYKPYGSTYTGSPPTVFFGWTGQSGAQKMGLNFAEQYNRARWYSIKTRQWISRDPIWPNQLAYSYVSCQPLNFTDRTGLALDFPPVFIQVGPSRQGKVIPPPNSPITRPGLPIPGGRLPVNLPGTQVEPPARVPFPGTANPGTGSLPGQADYKFNECLPVIIPIAGLIELTIETCAERFDSSCCPKAGGPWASQCHSFGLSAAASADVLFWISKAKKLTEHAAQAIELVTNLIYGVGFLSYNSIMVQKACRPISSGKQWDGSCGFSVCTGFGAFSCKIPGGCEWKFGYCVPGLDVGCSLSFNECL